MCMCTLLCMCALLCVHSSGVNTDKATTASFLTRVIIIAYTYVKVKQHAKIKYNLR